MRAVRRAAREVGVSLVYMREWKECSMHFLKQSGYVCRHGGERGLNSPLVRTGAGLRPQLGLARTLISAGLAGKGPLRQISPRPEFRSASGSSLSTKQSAKSRDSNSTTRRFLSNFRHLPTSHSSAYMTVPAKTKTRDRLAQNIAARDMSTQSSYSHPLVNHQLDLNCSIQNVISRSRSRGEVILQERHRRNS